MFTLPAMKIIHRYILSRFIVSLFFAMLFFLTIVICVDLVGNLATFIDKQVPLNIVGIYYIYYIPYILNTLGLPMAMLLASMFSIGLLAKHNEIIAIRTVGVSNYKILSSIIISSFIISCLALLFSETVVPKASQAKSAIEDEYIKKQRTYKTYRNILVRDAIGRRIFIAMFSANTNIANRVTVQTFDEERIVERLDIKSMQWKDGQWQLKSGYKRTFANGFETAVLLPDTTDPYFNFTPEQLTESQTKPENMSYLQLNKFIADVERNGGDSKKWAVSLNFKLSLPFSNFILVLFGAPLAAGKRRSGAIFGLILSALIFLIYFGMMRFVQTLGELGQIDPLSSAWITNAVFLMVGLGMLMRANR